MKECLSFSEIFRNLFIGEDILNFIKKFLTKIKDAFTNKEKAYQLFEANLIFLKFLTLFLFIVLCAVNIYKKQYTGIAKNKSMMFGLECFVFGLSAVIPYLLFYLLRSEKYCFYEMIITSVVLLALFAIVNILLEFSGFYNVFYGTDEGNEGGDTAESSPLNKFIRNFTDSTGITTCMIYAVSLFAMVICALIVHNIYPNYRQQISRNNIYLTILIFLVEAFVFGTVSAIPIYLIAYNRDSLQFKQTTKEFFIIAGKFSLIHVVLQLSGFYKNIF